MIERIVNFSIQWRVLVVLLAVALAGFGLYSAADLPIERVYAVLALSVLFLNGGSFTGGSEGKLLGYDATHGNPNDMDMIQ